MITNGIQQRVQYFDEMLKRNEEKWNGLDINERYLISLYYELRQINIDKGKESYEYRKTFQKFISDLKQYCLSNNIIEEGKIVALHKASINTINALMEYIQYKDPRYLNAHNPLSLLKKMII